MKRVYMRQLGQDGASCDGFVDMALIDHHSQVMAISIGGKLGSMLDARSILKARGQALQATLVQLSDVVYQEDGTRSGRPLSLHLMETGYRVVQSKMDTQGHVVAVSNLAFAEQPPFLLLGRPGAFEEALARHLREKTPVPFLPEWIPWIAQQILDQEYAFPLRVIGEQWVQERYAGWTLHLNAEGVQRLVSLGLEGGHLSMGPEDPEAEPLSPESQTYLTHYVRQYRNELAQIITEHYTPRFDPSEGRPDPIVSRTTRRLFQAQADVVQGVVETWKESNWAMIVGEMGVGKGVIAPVAPWADSQGKPFRCLVVCPGHLVHKWEREIQATVPGAKTEILRSWRDFVGRDPRKAPEAPQYLIVSRSRVKLDYGLRKGAWHRARRGQDGIHKCPSCGVFFDLAYEYRHGRRRSTPWAFESRTERNAKCPNCETPLWQADKDGVRRYSMARWISRRMKGWLDYLILDEVHEDKGAESAQGEAMGQLVGAAPKTLALTGTLLGGYADDLFYLLYRFEPSKMRRHGFGYHGGQAFNDRYGTVEHARRRQARSSRAGQVSRRRLPGVSPMIFPLFLMDNTTFLDLSDLGHDLPSYHEEVQLVEMDEELRGAYDQVAGELRNALGSGRRISRVALGAYVNSLLAYVDHPYVNRPVTRRNKDTGELEVVTEPPVLTGSVRHKEEELIWRVQQELAEGRRCYVYVNFTGDWKADERIKEVLESAGVRTALLSTSVPQEKREEWLQKKVLEGVDVIVSHPRLVQTGLDLYDFPTLIFYQTGLSIYTLRQAARRSWRIGQTKPVRVVFMAYRDTLQEDALRLMGSKLEASTAIEGKFSEEGLRAMADSEDMTSALARALVEGLSGVDSAEAIWSRIGRHDAPVEHMVIRTLAEMFERGVLQRPRRKTKKTQHRFVDGQLAMDLFGEMVGLEEAVQ